MKSSLPAVEKKTKTSNQNAVTREILKAFQASSNFFKLNLNVKFSSSVTKIFTFYLKWNSNDKNN